MDTQGVNTKITVDNEQAITGFQEAGEAANTYAEDTQTASETVTSSHEDMVTSNQNVTSATRETTGSMKEGVLGASEAAAGGVGLIFTLDAMEVSQTAVEKANKNVDVANLAVQKSQEAYNAAVSKYGPNSQQAKDALDKLNIATQQQSIALEKQKEANDNNNETMMMTAATVLPELISTISGISTAYGVFSGMMEGSAAAEDVAAGGTDALSGSMDLLDLSMLPIILVVGAIALAAYLIYTNWGTLSSFFSGLWNEVVGFFNWAWGIISPVVNDIGSIVGGVMNGIETVFKTVFGIVVGVVQFQMGLIKAFIIDPITAVYNILSGLFDDITGVFRSAFGIIQSVVQDVMNVIMPIIQPFVDAMNVVGDVVNAISSAGNDIISGVTSFLGGGGGGSSNSSGSSDSSSDNHASRPATSTPSATDTTSTMSPTSSSATVSPAVAAAQMQYKSDLSNVPGLGATQAQIAEYQMKLTNDQEAIQGFASGGLIKATPGGTVVRVGEGDEDEYVVPKSKMGSVIPTSVNSSSSTSSSSSVSIGTIIIQGGSGQDMMDQFVGALKQQNIRVSTC